MNTVISLLLLYLFNSIHKDTSYDIAKALLERIDELPGLSVSDFASDLGTSITTVNRFCKELGFQSFKNMKMRLEATRKGRIGQIQERLERMSEDQLLEDMEKILQIEIDREEFTGKCRQIAELFHRSRRSFLSGAVYPMALSLDFVEDMFLMGCPIGIIHNSYRAVDASVSCEDFILILSNTGRFITMNTTYFLTLYTKPWKMAVVSQNQQFSKYDKLSVFLHLPQHTERKEDNLILCLVLDLIEYYYYQNYGKALF